MAESLRMWMYSEYTKNAANCRSEALRFLALRKRALAVQWIRLGKGYCRMARNVRQTCMRQGKRWLPRTNHWERFPSSPYRSTRVPPPGTAERFNQQMANVVADDLAA